MSRWLLRKFDRIDPEVRRIWAARLLLLSLIGWPASQLTLARSEPPFILGLSWFAIVATCVDVLATTDVRKDAEE